MPQPFSNLRISRKTSLSCSAKSLKLVFILTLCYLFAWLGFSLFNVLFLCHHQAGDTNPPICFFSSPVNLTYDVFDGKGESTPLVFLHGLFGSKSNFHSIAKSLVQRTGRKVMQGWRHYTGLCCYIKNKITLDFDFIFPKVIKESRHGNMHSSSMMPVSWCNCSAVCSFVINADGWPWFISKKLNTSLHNRTFVCAAGRLCWVQNRIQHTVFFFCSVASFLPFHTP